MNRDQQCKNMSSLHKWWWNSLNDEIVVMNIYIYFVPVSCIYYPFKTRTVGQCQTDERKSQMRQEMHSKPP